MRAFFIVILASLSLLALDLPVNYDPFNSAKKIIKKSHKPIFFTPFVRPLQLQAIFNDKAYINGKSYKRGDIIRGFKIVDIKDSYVILQRGKKKRVLVLYRPHVLKVVEK
ncbi:hypothetical protein [Nitratiruptor sp. YY09-18]|uniref:hypothetical protein n=1 Tax=Nitratiruptor sp. YY09-18 TaxID=2724901 RepID=UPI0019160CA4|nr:hypothetical protein [Nitratiruptor sp. YY09-18]BCD68673.1 hypothetical protein NitYY0918_C1590 [Nitratiruptor sp. YY09-18]